MISRHVFFWFSVLAGMLFSVFTSGNVYADEAKGEENGKEESTDEPDRPAVGLEGIELKELEDDFEPKIKRFIIPPYYQEQRGPVKLKLVFPLFYFRERTGPGARKDLGILPFYWRHRGEEENADVYFPFYWRFRGRHFKTDVVLQTHYNRSDHGYNFGFSPLIYLGKDTRDASSYQVIPPLFWRFVNGDSSFLLAGIYYQHKDGENFDLGLPPLFFAGRERYKTYMVALPPLFWRFTDEIAYKTTNVVPPFFFNTREHGWSFGLVPLLYLARDKDWDRTLITPFYYGSRWQKRDKTGEVLGEGKSYYFPLLLSYYRRGPGLSQGGAAIFYHWYWNEGEYLKMFSPLVWLFGNDRTDDDAVLIPPLFYRRTSPVRDDTMAGLVYWNFHQHHRERTFALMPLFAHNWNLYETNWRTWVAPTFDFGKQPDGYHVRLHPLFYLGKKARSDHFVLAPLVWKFTDEEDDDLVLFPFYWRFRDLLHDDSARVVFPLWWQFDDRRKNKYNRVAFPFLWDFHNARDGERSTIIPPLFWRDRDRRSTMTGFLNFVWHRGEVKGNRFWTFRFDPFIGFGHPPSPSGAYWSVLRGLVGWRRQGSSKQLKLFWIPINLSD
ncbi:MAG: hypothetical protein GY854_09650 [Deltaproteobacteria bacterium]|nr:hypothetical protein [Deltaproteobacteria bacterium]